MEPPIPSRDESLRILYGGLDPQNKPRYTLAQAARYLHLSPSTLRSWVRGREYPKSDGTGSFKPLIKADSLLSFSNLVEAHVLRALRVDHSVQMSAVRKALDYAQRSFKIKRLLLSQELLAAPGNVFIERYGQLVNLGLSGQLAVKHLLAAQLKRVEWDPSGLPCRLFPAPLEGLGASGRKLIVIDPQISSGNPIVASRAVRTSVIVNRIDAGESPESVAEDYQLEPSEVEAAILYERAA